MGSRPTERRGHKERNGGLASGRTVGSFERNTHKNNVPNPRRPRVLQSGGQRLRIQFATGFVAPRHQAARFPIEALGKDEWGSVLAFCPSALTTVSPSLHYRFTAIAYRCFTMF